MEVESIQDVAHDRDGSPSPRPVKRERQGRLTDVYPQRKRRRPLDKETPLRGKLAAEADNDEAPADLMAAISRALHVSTCPAHMPGRERERGIVLDFLRAHAAAGKGGALYVCGSPGTGKTAMLRRLLGDAGRAEWASVRNLAAPRSLPLLRAARARPSWLNPPSRA